MGSPYLMYDGAKVSRESQLGKELEKWERPFDYDPAKNQFPRMLYRARHRPDGRRSVHEVLDSLFPVQTARGPEIVAGAAEQWSAGCQLTVYTEAEMIRAFENGWRKTPQEALELLEARDNARSNATAERHASDARMSEPAQREAAAEDQKTLKHLPEIPEKRRLSPEAKQRRRESLAKARAVKAAKKNSEPVPA